MTRTDANATQAPMRIGVIGGGLMGLAAADRLSQAGHRVHVFERGAQPGGLATWHDFGECVWDKYYHVILPSDSQLIGFIRELGLADKLRWRPTQTGYYVDKRCYSLSTNVDFLRFPLLGPISKFRLALNILYASRIDDWRALERISVEEWLRRWSGDATFEKFWKPLLLAKLGEHYTRVSAVFIWTYIKRLFSARDATAQREHLGHVSGGYRTVFERLVERLRHAGGELELGAQVTRIATADGERIAVVADGRTEVFDKVLFTGPVNVLRQVADRALVDLPQSGRDVEYLGVICMVLITRRPLTPYYVLNISDETIPFTGVIGMSTVVDPAETNGLYITYLPKYVLSDDPLLQADDASIRAPFMEGLLRMFPQFDPSDVCSVHINRALKVQPLQVTDYSSLAPRVETKHPSFFVLNSAQFVNNTLNNNEVVRNVNDFFVAHGEKFHSAASLPGERVPLRATA